MPVYLIGVFAALVAAAAGQPSREPLRVEWHLEAEERGGSSSRPQFTLIHRPNPQSQWVNSTNVDLAGLQGLNPAHLASDRDSPVRFTVAKEAGRLDCTGAVRRGNGSGTCDFHPDAAYAAAAARYLPGPLTTLDLYALADHDITIDYISGLRGLGIRNLTPQSLARLKSYGVSAEYVRELREAGARSFSADELTRLKSYGVSPALVAALHTAGYRDVSADALTRMQSYGVSASYVRGLAEAGISGPDTDDLVRLQQYGVPADYPGEVRSAGYRHFGPDDFVRLWQHGVSASFIRQTAERRGTGLSADELVRIRDGGEH